MSSPAALHRVQPIGMIGSRKSPIIKGTIVHLGAGDGRDLPEYAGAQRVILVEADPEQARELRRAAKNDGRLVVIAAAVSAVAGANRLKRFRLKAFNSLRAPTGLHDLYPGLRLHDEIEVEAVTPRDLIGSHGLRPQQDNWLIIDTPGEEAAIVQSLRDSGDLAVFDHIDLCCGIADHYEGAGNAASVLRMLDEEGYDVESCDDSADPERPRWSLRRNPLRLQNRGLREQLAESAEARDRLTQQLAEALDELKLVKTAAETAQSQMAKEAGRLAGEHRAEIERLNRERDEWCELATLRDQQIKELNLARDELAQRLSTHESHIGELSREKDAALTIQGRMAREIGELRTEVERLRALEVELRGQLSVRDTSIDRLAEERDSAVAQTGSLGRQIEAVRAQANKDTEALRGRLSEAMSNAERLGQLLAERESVAVALDAEVANLRAEMGKVDQQVAELNRNLEERAKSLLAKDTEIQNLSQALSERESAAGALDAEVRILREQLVKRDAQIADLGRKLEERQKSVAARDAEIQTLRSDLSVAIRLQSMREADLRDLQIAYAGLLHEKKERDELLADLSSRLDIVARYLTRKQ